ncbi:MAG: hypothetical protein NZ580_00710 [Bacteroidia bacterium]|nr:hypothetical protein [Bacteroidia bacterium]MDW8235215.1 hypothetical protein [Bacteroidia bacterium]
MVSTKVEPIQLEAQLHRARRILTLELNRYKVSGKAALSEQEITHALDVLRELERKGVRHLAYVDLLRLQRILLKLPPSEN